MLSQQSLRGFVHDCGVQWLVHPPRTIAIKRRSLETIENAILVAAIGCRKPRVKRLIDGVYPGHVDVIGKIAVRPEQPATRTSFAACIKVDYLARCVHARVGSTRADDLYRFIGDQCECFFETLLYAQSGFLPLPAVITRAVVFDAGRDANIVFRQLGRESSSCCACCRWPSSPSSSTSSRMLRAPPGSPMST